MNRITKISFGICLLSSIFACNTNDNDFSKTPELFFRSFIDQDSVAVWSLGFTDGDGDIGTRDLDDPENFFVTSFSIEDGVPVQLPDTNLYRVPAIQNISTRNGIEGEFKFTIEKKQFQINNIDSAFMQGYVVDRSNNRSNDISTPIFEIN